MESRNLLDLAQILAHGRGRLALLKSVWQIFVPVVLEIATTAEPGECRSHERAGEQRVGQVDAVRQFSDVSGHEP